MKKIIIILLSLLFAININAQNYFQLIRSGTAQMNPPVLGEQSYVVLSDTEVNLTGYVNPRGSSTAARFLYGTSTGTYTDSISAAQNPLTGSITLQATASLTGLTPSTAYYAKLIAYSTYGRVEHTGELQFTTQSTPITDNLVDNGDIENAAKLGVSPYTWTDLTLSGDELSISTVEPMEGNQSLIVGHGSGHSNWRPVLVFVLTEPMVVGNNYTLRYNIKGLTGTPTIGLSNYGRTGETNPTISIGSVTNFIDSNFVCSEANTAISFYMRGDIAAGTFAMDNVSLQQEGGGDTTPPTFVSASISDNTPTTITMVLSESCTGTTGFTVTRNSVAIGISSTVVNQSTVTLTLGAPITPGDVIRVSYNSGTGDVADVNDNVMASFSNNVVANNVVNPYLISATVENSNPSQIVLTFNEPITFEDSTGFAVEVDIVSADIDNISGEGTTNIMLNMKSAISNGESIAVTYDDAVGNVVDSWNNPLLDLSTAVVNNVYPAATAPLMVNDGPTGVSANYFTALGRVDPKYADATVKVQWGETITANDDSVTINTYTGGGSYQNVSRLLGGLLVSTKYYFKFSATNSVARTVSAVDSATTADPGGLPFTIPSITGTSYYISASGTGNGLSEETPAGSGSVVSIMNSLTAGDAILFKRGDVINCPNIADGWFTNYINSSGDYITIGAYGSEALARPVLTLKNSPNAVWLFRIKSLSGTIVRDIKFEGKFYVQGSEDVRTTTRIGGRDIILYKSTFEGRSLGGSRVGGFQIYTGWSLGNAQWPDSNTTANLRSTTNLPSGATDSFIDFWCVPIHNLKILSCQFFDPYDNDSDGINLWNCGDSLYIGYSQFQRTDDAILRHEDFIDVAAGTGHILEYNFVTGFDANGIKIHSQYNTVQDLIVRGNVVWGSNQANASSNAFVLEGVKGAQIYNNTFIAGTSPTGIFKAAVFFWDRHREDDEGYYSFNQDIKYYNNISCGTFAIRGVYMPDQHPYDWDVYNDPDYSDSTWSFDHINTAGWEFNNNIFWRNYYGVASDDMIFQSKVLAPNVHHPSWEQLYKVKFSLPSSLFESYFSTYVTGSNNVDVDPDFFNFFWSSSYNYGDLSPDTASPAKAAGTNYGTFLRYIPTSFHTDYTQIMEFNTGPTVSEPRDIGAMEAKDN